MAYETVELQRRRLGRRDHAEPPGALERLERPVRQRAAKGDPRGLGRSRRARGPDHGRRPGVLVGGRPQGDARAGCLGGAGAGGRRDAERALPPDHQGNPGAAQARRRRGERAGRRDRVLAGAGLRPDLGRRVRDLRARVREHRAGARTGARRSSCRSRRARRGRSRWRCSATRSPPSRRSTGV